MAARDPEAPVSGLSDGHTITVGFLAALLVTAVSSGWSAWRPSWTR